MGLGNQQMQAVTNQELSSNGILYLSSGFTGPFIFQIIACHVEKSNNARMCLTDGELYIGATYSGQLPDGLITYSILKVWARYTSRWTPMYDICQVRVIDSLEMVSNGFNYLLGRAPKTIEEYFQKQGGQAADASTQSLNNTVSHSNAVTQSVNRYQNGSKHFVGQKKVHKCSSDESIASDSLQSIGQIVSREQTQIIDRKANNTTQMDTATQKACSQYPNPSLPHQNISIKQIANKQCPQQTNIAQPNNRTIYQADQTIKYDNKVIYDSFIGDLYERMPRWKLLCRINYIRFFVSAKGNKCAVIQLIDQKGDQIRAMLYCGNLESQAYEQLKQALKEGRTYTFSKGQVVQQVNEDKMSLELILHSHSEISIQENVWICPISSFTSLKDLLATDGNSDIVAVGIIQSIENINESRNQQKRNKIKGILCNPVSMICVQFVKNYLQGESVPAQGTICVLHYFKCCKYGNAIRLMGSSNEGRKSYISSLSPEDIGKSGQKFQEIKLLGESLMPSENQKPKWESASFYNLSKLTFKKRTIREMLMIAKATDSTVFSELLCSVTEVKLKKQYMACPSCKRSSHQEEVSLWYCIKCCKVVEPGITLIISIGLADSTGNISIEVIGDKAEAFIGMEVPQFWGLLPEDKECHLQMARFQSFMIRLRSEKKGSYELIHSLQQVEKQQLQLTMQEIRRRTVENKLHLKDNWEEESASRLKIE